MPKINPAAPVPQFELEPHEWTEILATGVFGFDTCRITKLGTPAVEYGFGTTPADVVAQAAIQSPFEYLDVTPATTTNKALFFKTRQKMSFGVILQLASGEVL